MDVIRRKENDSLIMICNYSGYPKGTITWMIGMFYICIYKCFITTTRFHHFRQSNR